MTTTTKDLVLEYWENTEKRLEEIARSPREYLQANGYDEDDDPIVVFLDHEVLEIKREQFFDGKKWETTKYILILGVGGPHIEIDTYYQICVYLGGERIESATYNKKVREFIDQIESYLMECLP